MANYLTFASAEPFTIVMDIVIQTWDLYYSIDTANWNEWNCTTAIASAEHGGEHKIYMRGIGNKGFGQALLTSKFVLTGNNVRCIGNIETLLDYEKVANGEHPSMDAWCFKDLFRDCTALTQAPELPATTLAIGCYYGMFFGCTNLTQAPALPATMLADSCYRDMFQRCTSLTQAPELPATTLAKECYYCMFGSCTSLTQPPALPATTMADSCYSVMFNGCAGIKLSETQTAEYATEYRIPSSGTGTTATDALRSMFYSTGGEFTGTPEINTTYYLAVPVPNPIDPQSLTAGWLVGRRIAAMRGKKTEEL